MPKFEVRPSESSTWAVSKSKQLCLMKTDQGNVCKDKSPNEKVDEIQSVLVSFSLKNSQRHGIRVSIDSGFEHVFGDLAVGYEIATEAPNHFPKHDVH